MHSFYIVTTAMIKVQHSIVSPASILRVIQRYYPAIGATDCELLELGCNDNFRIKGKRRDYVFRLYRLKWWPEKAIDEELRLLEALRRHKLDVCQPVRSVDKKRYIKVNAPEGRRYGALFVFIPGRQLGFNFGKRNINMVKLGGLVAQMHTLTDNMKQPIARWTLGFDNVVNSFLDQAPIVLGHREKDLRYLHKLANQLETVLLDQPEGAFNFGLCHGDLHTHNVMLQPDGELALFDFDWCGYSWRAYDLATIWWTLAFRNTPLTPWRAFLRGYTQQRTLSKQEKSCLPWFVVFRHFEYLNFQLAMRKHIGTAWLGDNYYDFQLKFLKRWVKDYLK